MTLKPRQRWVDVARAVSVLAIILFHFLIWVYFPGMHERHPALVAGWEKVADLTSTFRLPLLFMVSGFLVGPRIREGFANRKNLLSAATNAWLYVVWLTVFALCSLAIKPGIPLRVSSVDSYLRQLILPRTIVWFIFALALWTLVLCVLRRLPAIATLGATFVLSSSAWMLPRPPGEMYVQVLFYGFFFAVGAYLPRMIRWLASRPHWTRALAAAALVVVALVVLPWVSRQGFPWPTAIRVLKDLTIAAAAVPAAVLLARIPLLGRALAYLGRRTLPMYVLQLPILWAVIMVRPRMPWGNAPFQMLSPFIGVIGTIAVALALHWIIVRTPARVLFTLPRPLANAIQRGTVRT